MITAFNIHERLFSLSKFLIIFVIYFFVSAHVSYAATYYIKWDATGAGNGTSWTDAYTTIQSAITANTASGNVFEISGGTTGHTYTEIVTTGAVTSGSVTVKGSSQAGHNGWVKISGAGGSAGQNTFTAARNTTLQNLELTGAVSTSYNLLNSGKTITATNVYITDGDRGVYNNGTLNLTNFRISGLTGAWLVNHPLTTNTSNLTYGVVEGNYAGFSIQKGTFNIKNVLIEGSDLDSLDVASNNSQILTLKNTIIGSGGHGNRYVHNVVNTSSNATITATNNLILANGQDAETYNISNFTSTSSLFESPKFVSMRRPYKIALAFHANGEDLWKSIADYGEAHGIYALYYRNALNTLTQNDWDDFLTYQNRGHGIGILSRNHSSLINFNGITIDGPAGSTVDITVDESDAQSADWTGTLTLNESGSPALYTINLSQANASYDTLAELVDEINTKTGWVATVVETGNGTGLGNKRRGIYSTALASVTGVSTSSVYTALLDRNRFYYTEMVEEKALAESKGLIVNTQTTPGGANDADFRDWISTDTHGYFAKAGTTPFLGAFRSDTSGSYTLTSDETSGDPLLSGFQVYNGAWEIIPDYIGTTDIERNAATLLDWMGYIGGSMLVLGHDTDDYSEANWKAFVDVLIDNGVEAPNLEDVVDYIRSGTDVDADGQRWTRTFSSTADYHLQYTSPVIDAGTNLSLTTDIEGNPIYGTPDMGPYEYQPPYTIGTHEIEVGESVRVYADGKYRYTTVTDGGATADLEVTPVGGFGVGNYAQWMDISVSSWSTSGSYLKEWTETPVNTGLSAVHTIGDFSANTSYDVSVDGVVYTTVTSDGSGVITFTYSGGYASPKSFSVQRTDSVPDAPTVGTGTAISDSEISWSFTDNSYNEQGFKLYDASDVLVTTLASSDESSISETGLTENTLYSGRYVTAYNALGDSSPTSDFASVYTRVGTPTHFTASAITKTTATLSVDEFTNDTTGSSGYYFSRTGADSGWTTEHSWNDTGLLCGTTYEYSVKYRNAASVETSSVDIDVTTASCQGIRSGSVATRTLPVVVNSNNKTNVITKKLEYAMTDNEIVLLQKYLNGRSFIVATTGSGSKGKESTFFGIKTRDALKKFQMSLLSSYPTITSELGVVGDITRSEINSTYSKYVTDNVIVPKISISTILKKGMVSDEVSALQRVLLLDKEVYPEGVVNGKFGPLTEKAVQRFQIKYGIVRTSKDQGYGIVGPKTRAKLIELAQ